MNELQNKFNQFCQDNIVNVCRGNVYEVVKVTDYNQCLDLLKNHPRNPFDLNDVHTMERIHRVMDYIMENKNERIVHTIFSLTTFGVNLPHLGQDIIYEIRKKNQNHF